ncbi:MAG: sigma-70 family RNA polymerase sigma factor, partial [Moorea sp. SIO4A3]|nr:sigma-70 family RNA polymerase sigma factor [Moorena sp. SIO4A3]
ALTWRHIYHELGGMDLREDYGLESTSFQNQIINLTAVCINQADLPPVESIHYNLNVAPPPLWCYLEMALEQLPPAVRLMVIMAQTFHWSETRIAAYLQAEGEMITPAQVRKELQEGYELLEAALPEDIRVVYLGVEAKNREESDLFAVPVLSE